MQRVVGCTARRECSSTCVRSAKHVADIEWPGSCAATKYGRFEATKFPTHRRPSFHHCAEPTATRIHRRASESSLGHRHHLHLNLAGLPLPGGCHGSVRARNCWLVNETHTRQRTRARCAPDGGMAAQPSRPRGRAFRPRLPVRQRRMATLLRRPSSRSQHESPR
jgi:hypothetical protein